MVLKIVTLLYNGHLWFFNGDRFEVIYTVKPAHKGQIRSRTKSTVRSRWPLRATATYEIIFMDRIKKKSTR